MTLDRVRTAMRLLVALLLGLLGLQLANHSSPGVGTWMENVHFGLGVLEAIGAVFFAFVPTAALGGSILLLSLGTAFGIHVSNGQIPSLLVVWAALVVVLSPGFASPRTAVHP